MKNGMKLLALICVITALIAFTCIFTGKSEVTTDKVIARVEKYTQNMNDENYSEMRLKLIDEIAKMPADEIIEEVIAVGLSGEDIEYLYYHMFAIKEKIGDISFDTFLKVARMPLLHPMVKKSALQLYDDKQYEEGNYEKGIDTLIEIALDKDEDVGVRTDAIYCMPTDSGKAYEFLKQHQYKLGEELDSAVNKSLRYAYYNHLTDEEILDTLSDYMNSDIVKLRASIDRWSDILRDNENNLPENELLKQKAEYTDICISIFEKYPLFNGEYYVYSDHPSYDAAFGMAQIGYEGAYDYIRYTLPKLNRLEENERQRVYAIAFDSIK